MPRRSLVFGLAGVALISELSSRPALVGADSLGASSESSLASQADASQHTLSGVAGPKVSQLGLQWLEFHKRRASAAASQSPCGVNAMILVLTLHVNATGHVQDALPKVAAALQDAVLQALPNATLCTPAGSLIDAVRSPERQLLVPVELPAADQAAEVKRLIGSPFLARAEAEVQPAGIRFKVTDLKALTTADAPPGTAHGAKGGAGAEAADGEKAEDGKSPGNDHYRDEAAADDLARVEPIVRVIGLSAVGCAGALILLTRLQVHRQGKSDIQLPSMFEKPEAPNEEEEQALLSSVPHASWSSPRGIGF